MRLESDHVQHTYGNGVATHGVSWKVPRYVQYLPKEAGQGTLETPEVDSLRDLVGMRWSDLLAASITNLWL